MYEDVRISQAVCQYYLRVVKTAIIVVQEQDNHPWIYIIRGWRDSSETHHNTQEGSENNNTNNSKDERIARERERKNSMITASVGLQRYVSQYTTQYKVYHFKPGMRPRNISTLNFVKNCKELQPGLHRWRIS